MVTVGVDAHKRINMAVAIDAAGREVARWRGPNSTAGWQQLAAWASAHASDIRWGIEGAWNYGRGLAQCLVASGAIVYEVNARWTAAGRRRARTMAKSDGRDARAVALVVWREAAALPTVTADDETGVLGLLVGERDYATADARPLQQRRAAAVRRLAQRLQLLAGQARELAAQIRAQAARYAPLVTICGIDLLTAAALAGLLGPGRRFASDAQLAAYAGVAPLETSSAERVRHRLNRGGNRQLNALLYRIALTQARCSPMAQAYLARRTGEGKTKREAVRGVAPSRRTPDDWVRTQGGVRCPVLTALTRRSSGRGPCASPGAATSPSRPSPLIRGSRPRRCATGYGRPTPTRARASRAS